MSQQITRRVALGVATQGSHRSGRAQLRHPVRQVTASLSRFAIRGRYGDRPPEDEAPDLVPDHGSVTRHPLPSPGSSRYKFPRFNGTMRCCDLSPPISPRFVSFAWRYLPCTRLSLPTLERVRQRRAWGWYPVAPSGMKERRRRDLPSSWGTLLCLRPALGPRRDQRYQAITVGQHGPTRIQLRGLSTRGNFGARSHGIGTRCLRFAPWVTPKDARLTSGCWPALPDGIGYPQGSYERFPRCFLHRFPLSQAAWRSEVGIDLRRVYL